MPIVGEGYSLNAQRTLGLILSEWSVTPSEIFYIMDGLRLFVDGWDHYQLIEPIAILSLLVNMVRGKPLTFSQERQGGHIKIKGISWTTDDSGSPSQFSLNEYLSVLHDIGWKSMRDIERLERHSRDPALNYVTEFLYNEIQSRRSEPFFYYDSQSHFADYIPRVYSLARFFDNSGST